MLFNSLFEHCKTILHEIKDIISFKVMAFRFIRTELALLEVGIETGITFS